MKQKVITTLFLILFLLAVLIPNAAPVYGQDPEETAGTATDTPQPTSTSTLRPTEPPLTVDSETPEETLNNPADRPVVVITSYYLDKDTIRPNDSFNLFVHIRNDGQTPARNLIFSFGGTGFLPQETGGVIVVGDLANGATAERRQRFLADTSLWGKVSGTISVNLSYTDQDGVAFSEAFNITLDVQGWSGVVASTATPTPTAPAAPRAQLVVSSYSTNIDPLQPGSLFTMNMNVQNLGNGNARDVTMIMGGGSFGSTGNPTPEAGGVSGGGSDLSVFAPIGSSNLQVLGDISPGTSLQASQQLIVNVSANPGAYTLKLSFAYSDDKGTHMLDDQIVTLLVYQLPNIEVNFYRDPGPISAMAPNTLPLQAVNLGRKAAVMGNMTVSADNADLMNNSSLVGTLDTGGYFPLDVMMIPHAAGPVEITVTINYTDDFNTPRTITQVIPIEVVEGMSMDPGMGEGMGPDGQPFPGEVPMEPPAVEETFWQKALRFVKGLFGLDSAPPQPGGMPGEMMPDGEFNPDSPAFPGGAG